MFGRNRDESRRTGGVGRVHVGQPSDEHKCSKETERAQTVEDVCKTCRLLQPLAYRGRALVYRVSRAARPMFRRISLATTRIHTTTYSLQVTLEQVAMFTSHIPSYHSVYIVPEKSHHYHHRMKQTRFRGTVQAQCIAYDTIQLTIKHFIDQSHPQLATLQPDLLQSQLAWNASVPPLQANVSMYVMLQDRPYIPASFSLSISATMASIWAKSRLCWANKS